MLRESAYNFKHKKDILLFYKLRLDLQIIFLAMSFFCDQEKMPRPTITSSIRGKLKRSISTTHEEGRAIDIRSWVYTDAEIEKLLGFVNGQYAAQYGTGPFGKTPLCLVYEGDLGPNSHFHLQVRR